VESELAVSIRRRIARSSQVTMATASLELGEPQGMAGKPGGGAETLCAFVRAAPFPRVSTYHGQ